MKRTRLGSVAVGDRFGAELVTVIRIAMTFQEIAELTEKHSTPTTIVAIDAPLVIPNDAGMRVCERDLSREFHEFHAGTYPSNRSTFRGGGPPLLAQMLAERGFRHSADLDMRPEQRWMIEVYPHPAFVRVFSLNERIIYKKGSVDVKRAGLGQVRRLLRSLDSREPTLTPGDAGQALLESALTGSPKALEDKLDAWFCVYIAQHAYRWGLQRNVVFGTERDGYIAVPMASEVRVTTSSAQAPSNDR